MNKIDNREKLVELLDNAAVVMDAPDSEQVADYLIANDVAVVVRCKDCKRWKADGGYGLDLGGTKRLYGKCLLTNMSYKENHFCCFGARGEKRRER